MFDVYKKRFNFARKNGIEPLPNESELIISSNIIKNINKNYLFLIVLFLIIVIFSNCSFSVSKIGKINYNHGIFDIPKKIIDNKSISIFVLNQSDENDPYGGFGWFGRNKKYISDEKPEEILKRILINEFQLIGFKAESVKPQDIINIIINNSGRIDDDEITEIVNNFDTDYIFLCSIEEFVSISKLKLINHQYLSNIKLSYMLIKKDSKKIVTMEDLDVSSTHKWLFSNAKNVRKSIGQSIKKIMNKIFKNEDIISELNN